MTARALAVALALASASRAQTPRDGGDLGRTQLNELFSKEDWPTLSWSDATPEKPRAVIARADGLEVFRIGRQRQVTTNWNLIGKASVEEEVRAGDWQRDLLGRHAGSGSGILSYPVLKRVPAEPNLLSRLRELVESSRYGSYNKFCGEIEPSVGYRFQSATGGEVVELLICFRCGEADLVMGKSVRRLQIDGIQRPLLKLALESFPDDAELREAQRALDRK